MHSVYPAPPILRFSPRSALLPLIAAAFFCAHALAQPADDAWSVRGWNSSDGLPADEDYGLAQSTDGYLWIATSDGMFRFDGAKFTPVPVPQLNHSYDNLCYQVLAAKDGSVWWGLDHGRVVCWRQGRTTVWQTAQGMPNDTPTSMCEGADGAIYIAFDRLGVVKIADGQLAALPPLPGGQASCHITVDSAGTLWCAVSKELFCFRDGAFVQVASLPDDDQMWLDPSPKEGIWIRRLHTISHRSPSGATDQELKVSVSLGHISAFCEDDQGNIWVGTSDSARSGLYRVENGKFVQVGLDKHQVRSITTDREGNLWVTTLDDGIKEIRPRLIQFLKVDSELPAWGRVRSFARDGAGQAWVVLEDNSVFCQDGGQWKIMPQFSRNGNALGRAISIDSAPDGSVLVGTRDNGVFRCTAPDATPTPVSSGPPFTHLIAMLLSTSGDLWFSGNTAHIGRLRDGTLTSWDNPDRATAHLMAQNSQGDPLMAATGHKGEGRLYRMADGQIQEIQFPGTGDYPIHGLWYDQDGSIWIGFLGGGLGRLKDGQFVRVTSNDGLADDYVYQVLPDGLGRIWLMSSSGLSRIDVADFNCFAAGQTKRLRVATFAQEEKELDPEVAARSTGLYVGYCCRVMGDQLWFSYGNGILIVTPRAWVANNLPPPVVIEAMRVDGRALTIDTGLPGELKLPPTHSRIEFDYAALSYNAPEDNQYRYMLQGYDKQWIDAGTGRQATYSRLAAGNYRFRVIACNSDGIWNEVGAGVPFAVAPFFWQTLWFRSLSLLGFACLVGALVRRRFHSRLLALEHQASLDKERARIARDIHDDLGGSLTQIMLLSGFVSRDKSNPVKADGYALQINSAARHITDALDEIVWAVNPGNDTLPHLVNYLGQFAAQFLHTSGLKCQMTLPERPDERFVSAEIRHNLFLVVKEALNNVARHASASEVRMDIAFNGESMDIDICDNGQGFDRAPINGCADGLRNMSQRMEEIAGKFQIDSKPGTGTRVSLSLPLSPRK